MEDIKQELLTKEQYNEIPVLYCKQCLSLKIMQVYGTIDYCDNCGSTDVEETDINSWEQKYIETNGEPYIIKENKNERKENFKFSLF